MRIGVIGLGFMGTTHIQALRNVDGATLAAVCSSDPKKLEGDLSGISGNLGNAGEKLDFSNVRKYSDVTALLADPEIDAVDITTPTHTHAPISIAALRAGKHVLVEKPMTLNPAEADELMDAAHGAGRLLMAAQVLRFFPSYRALRTELGSGAYGTVRSALFRRRCAAPAWNKWLGDPSKSGGGVFDLLIHDFDYSLHLFGPPNAVSATGYEDLPSGIDQITALLHYPAGPQVVITGGWHHPKAYPFSMEYTVSADGATFEYSSTHGGVTRYDAKGESTAVDLPQEEAFEAELRYFVECCRSGKTPDLCPPEESANAVKLALAAVESRVQGGEKIACKF